MPCGIFIPRTWRLHSVLWVLMIAEIPLMVANLALFGIAAPNLYRTILWAEGGRRGFNSSPETVLLAAANYRPVKTPIVWSGFNTQYNLVIGVLCTFFFLVKATLFLMHIFWPLLSLILHIALCTLWAYSVYMQTAPDTIDPEHQNKGAPWYITKNCNIVDDKTIRGYCMQAKSAFAVSVLMLILYAFFILLSIYSLIPSSEAKQAYKARRAEKKAEEEKYAISPSDNEMTAEEQWQHMWELQQLPRTPGTAGGLKSPMTPRTRAFQSLGGEGTYASTQQQQHPPMPTSPYQYPQPLGISTTAMAPSPYQHYQQAMTAESPYQSNAEYYGQLETEWKGKGTAY